MVAVLQPTGDGKYIAIDRAVVLVGRSADCDAVISVSKKISRRHCCLVQVDEAYFVRDLGSMNGVWLNGSRVNRETQIKAGDRLAIGDVEFLFHPNARIEQKKTIAAVPPADEGAVANALPVKEADIPVVEVAGADNEGVKAAGEDKFEIVDDIIDLDDDLIATNEVEVIDDAIIDDPIVDIDDDDEADEIVIYDE